MTYRDSRTRQIVHKERLKIHDDSVSRFSIRHTAWVTELKVHRAFKRVRKVVTPEMLEIKLAACR